MVVPTQFPRGNWRPFSRRFFSTDYKRANANLLSGTNPSPAIGYSGTVSPGKLELDRGALSSIPAVKAIAADSLAPSDSQREG